MKSADNPLRLTEEERVEHEIRRHWIALLPPAFGSVLLSVFPIVVFSFVVAEFGTAKTDPWFWLVLGLYAVWILVVWSYLFMAITDYALDRWYITNKRLIDVEQEGLFNRRVSSLQLDKIQDVTVDVNGLLATFLSYGNLLVQSAGTSREFELVTARLPQKSREMIMESKMNNEE
jgi:uncharacterized membrane protein YdbT with pleckstrin-like domain